jgi:ABC-type branched-subunit amino acid transport system ATPase component
MVFVEQNASILMDIVDELHLMRTGRIVCSGTPAQLQTSGALEDVLLGRVSEEVRHEV